MMTPQSPAASSEPNPHLASPQGSTIRRCERPVCYVCGSTDLIEIRAKLTCTKCKALIENCCGS